MKNHFAVMAFLILLITSSCTNRTSGVDNEGKFFSTRMLESLTQIASFDANDESFKFVSKRGVRLSLDPSTLRFNNKSINGKVDVKFI